MDDSQCNMTIITNAMTRYWNLTFFILIISVFQIIDALNHLIVASSTIF